METGAYQIKTNVNCIYIRKAFLLHLVILSGTVMAVREIAENNHRLQACIHVIWDMVQSDHYAYGIKKG